MRKILAVSTSVLLFLAVIPALPAAAAEQQLTPAELYKRCSPSVVTVTAAETVPRGFLNRTVDLLDPFPIIGIPGNVLRFVAYPLIVVFNGPLKSGGSGVIIDDSGRFVTNYHVIKGSDVFWATLADGSVIRARVVASDKTEDIALLKMDLKEGRKVCPAALGTSEALVPGELVAAIGSPLGFKDTLSTGVVAGIDRRVIGPFQDFIQTDLTIGAGSSGGPLFNARGEVVGLTSLMYATVERTGGLTFSIPVDAVKDAVRQFETKGKIVRGFIGAHVKTVTPRLAEELKLTAAHKDGACVVEVGAPPWRISPAEEAGLQRGDIIVKYGDTGIGRAHTLARAVLNTPPGTQVKVEFYRGKELLARTVTVTER